MIRKGLRVNFKNKLIEIVTHTSGGVPVEIRFGSKIEHRNGFEKEVERFRSGLIDDADGNSNTETRIIAFIFFAEFYTTANTDVEGEFGTEFNGVVEIISVNVQSAVFIERPSDSAVEGGSRSEFHFAGDTSGFADDDAEPVFALSV